MATRAFRIADATTGIDLRVTGMEVTQGPQRYTSAGGMAIPEVSSTDVRALLKAGGDASHLVPRAVLQAIRDAGTYR